MILTTTPTVEGKTIRDYRGLVTGRRSSAPTSSGTSSPMSGTIVGGRSAAYERELKKARELAIDEIEAAARDLGADAVVGIDLDYEVVGPDGSMMMVSVNGTAVTLG